MKNGIIVGLISGLTITGASLAFANSQIQAILNNQIKVTLNGVTQTFRDETTNEIQYPITYMDRTYLPLRTVADLVGVNVDYDSATKTAVLTSNSMVLDGSEESIRAQLIGAKQWLPQYIVTERGEDVGLKEYYGTGIFTSNTGLIFKADNTFTCFIGIYGDNVSDYTGTYKIDVANSKIMLTYDSGKEGSIDYFLTESNIILDIIEDNSMEGKGNIRIGYKPKQKEEQDASENTLSRGKYTVNEVVLDAAGISNEDCSVTLKDKNEFEMYLGYGRYHSGTYEINKNLLICHALKDEWDGGAGAGERKTDVRFAFKVLTNQKIELINIYINDREIKEDRYKAGFTKGMTYNISKMYDANTYVSFIEKYKIETAVNPYNDGIQSNIKIYDMNSKELLSKNIFFDMQNGSFDYRINADKLEFSAYEFFESPEVGQNGIDNLYRVYYEVIEENGTLKVNVIREEKTDTKFTAAS